MTIEASMTITTWVIAEGTRARPFGRGVISEDWIGGDSTVVMEADLRFRLRFQQYGTMIPFVKADDVKSWG